MLPFPLAILSYFLIMSFNQGVSPVLCRSNSKYNVPGRFTGGLPVEVVCAISYTRSKRIRAIELKQSHGRYD